MKFILPKAEIIQGETIYFEDIIRRILREPISVYTLSYNPRPCRNLMPSSSRVIPRGSSVMMGCFSRTILFIPKFPSRAVKSAPVGPQPTMTTSVVSQCSFALMVLHRRDLSSIAGRAIMSVTRHSVTLRRILGFLCHAQSQPEDRCVV